MSIDWEIRAYFAVYILYLIYGLNNLLSVRSVILKNFSNKNPDGEVDFVDGFLGIKRDDSNDELENFNSYLKNWWMWYINHVIVSILFTKFWPQRRSLGHSIACMLALLCTVKLLFVAILICQLLTYYAISIRPSKRLTWTLSLMWMLVINVIKNSEMWYNTLGYTQYFILLLTLSWSLLRCCSFVLNKLMEKQTIEELLEHKYSLENFLGYTLYFPCMAHGPFLSYDRYMAMETKRKGIGLKLRMLFLQLLRAGLWWCVLHVALHFLYIHYMARNIAAVKLIQPTFGQHAIGYFMGQFFFLYYVITYGVGIAFANFDELKPPNPPRCIGCIHSYADMWKYFDEGLYEFLFQHIYAEICRKDSNMLLKLLATAATFVFVFVWHGCYTYVLIWSVLNFSCLVAEKIFKGIVTSRTYQNWTAAYLSRRNSQRFYALLATQLFIPAAFSNVYFISGMDVGNYLMRGAYRSGICNFLALSFCSYCFFQCAEVIAQRRKVDIKSNGR